MVIQPALLLAIQLQPLPAVTLTLPEPPVAATEALVEESVKVPEPAPWFTAKF